MEELKYFSKRRIANVLGVIIILSVMFLWIYILLEDIDGTPIIIAEGNSSFTLTIFGALSGLAGFALKHVFDSCDNYE